METSALVTDDIEVTVILESTLTSVDLTVTVEVEELKVTGISTEVRTVLVEWILWPVQSLVVREEVTVCAEAPYVTELHTLIECVDVTRLVRELVNPHTAIPDSETYAIVEVLTASLERVTPSQSSLPTLSLENTIVDLWRVLTKDCRILRTSCDHISSIFPVDITREWETVAEEVQIQTNVISSRGLPSKWWRNHTVGSYIRNLWTVDDLWSLAYRPEVHKCIVIDHWVTEWTYVTTNLEVVEPLVRPIHPRLVSDTPTNWTWREETPTLCSRETRVTVITTCKLEDVAAEEWVVNTGEHTYRVVIVTVIAYRVLLWVHQLEWRVSWVHQTKTLEVETTIRLLLKVPTCHYVQIVIVTELRSPSEDCISRDVICVVTPVRLIRRVVVVLSTTRTRVTSLDWRYAELSVAVCLVSEVTNDLQYVLNRLSSQSSSGRSIHIDVLLVWLVTWECAVHYSSTIEWKGTVLVIWSIDRLTTVLELTKDRLCTTGYHWLVICLVINRGIVTQCEPLEYLNLTLSTEVVSVILLVVELVDTILVVVTTWDRVLNLLWCARYWEVVNVAYVKILIEKVDPVSWTVVSVVTSLSITVLNTIESVVLIGLTELHLLLVVTLNSVTVLVNTKNSTKGIRTVVHVTWSLTSRGRSTRVVKEVLLKVSQPNVTINLEVVLPHNSTLVERNRAIIINGNLVLCRSFCSNEDYTITTSSTVYRCRSSILQYSDVLNVLWVNRVKVTLNTVDENESRTTLTERDGLTSTWWSRWTHRHWLWATTDVDITTLCWLTVSWHNVQTWDHTLERTRNVRSWTALELLATEVLNSTYELCLLQSTITYDNYLVYSLARLGKWEVDNWTATDSNFYGVVTEEWTLQNRSCWSTDGVLTVCVCCSTGRWTLNNDCCAWHWSLCCSVDNFTGDSTVLCYYIARCEQSDRTHYAGKHLSESSGNR